MDEILIVGTGALATLFAARLSQTGLRVRMLGRWKESIDSLNKNGAHIIDSNNIERAYPVQATDDPSECHGAKFALVLVKAWQTEHAAHQLKECLAEDGIALTLQNGLGNRETLTQDLGPVRVATGVVTVGATLLGPGSVRMAGNGIISLERNPTLGPVKEALESAKFKAHFAENIESAIWGKLVINTAINPLTALLQIPNGELLKRPAARELMIELALETAAVANAQNIQLPFENPVSAVEEVAQQTATNLSSMLQDVRRGAPTEIDAICGAVTRLGKTHHMPMPVNATCWKLVKASSEIAQPM